MFGPPQQTLSAPLFAQALSTAAINGHVTCTIVGKIIN